jgi:hypothetical protein
MNALRAEGLVLLVLHADGEGAARLAEDCRRVRRSLQTVWIGPWELRLGTLGT